MRAIACRRLYFLFIRSMAEYGLALKILSPEERKPLEALQQQALSTICSVGIRTAAVSLRWILGITSIAARNQILHAQFMQRLHCNNSNSNTAAIIYRSTINTRYPSGPRGRLSFLRSAHLDNPRWAELRARPTHKLKPLAPPSLVHKVHGSRTDRDKLKPCKPIDAITRDSWYDQDTRQDIATIKKNPRGSRTTLMLGRPSARAVYPELAAMLPRDVERPIVLWMLGVAISRDYCHGCQTEVAENRRQHAVLCAELDHRVRDLYAETTPLQDRDDIYDAGGTIIDIALQHPRTVMLDREQIGFAESRRRLFKLAGYIDHVTQLFTGHQRTVSPSAARARDEVRELVAAIPDRRFSCLSRTVQQVVLGSFKKISAHSIRRKQTIQEHVERPPLPTEDEIMQVLDLPVAREIREFFT
jgi:hypothetical protein